MSAVTSRRLINTTALLTLVFSVCLSLYWWQLGIFDDLESFQNYLQAAGWIGPVLFILVQIIQVVIPIIPGGISTAVGVLLFGPWWGFVYNDIGITIGSYINFWLARRYGKPFILHIVSEATYDKYIGYTKNQKKFDWFFAIAIVMPVAPDDVLCLLAGLTKMSWRKYFWIILLGKPLTIAAYGYALVYGAHWLVNIL